MSKNISKNPTIETKISLGTKFVRSCFHVLLFVTPLLLWPFTSEVFEFNKMIFVYLMTIIITTGWIFDSLQKQKFEIARTKLDLPILLFLLTQIASTIFSIDPHTSLWGYYSRFHGGLMSTVSYIILFYAFVTHFKNDQSAIFKIIKTIIATATITAIYGVLERLGIDKHIWVQDVQNRVFSTLGQPNWLSAYLIALLPITLHLATTSKHNRLQSTIYYLLSLLFLITITFTRSQSGLAATAIILGLLAFSWLKKQRNNFLILSAAAVVICLIFIGKDAINKTFKSLSYINPISESSLQLAQTENATRIGGSDSMLIRRIVWEGAIKLGLQFPLLGTGPETFGYSYYWVRPLAHNYTSETDFLYNKAHNEYLNFLATSGFIGLFTYLFLIYSILKTLTNNYHPSSTIQDLRIPLLLGFASILITNFIGFSVVNIALFTFLFPAMILSQKESSHFQLKLGQANYLTFILVGLISLLFLNKTRNMWLADVYYAKGRANLVASEQAVRLNPKEPLYKSQLGYLQSLVVSQVIYPQLPSLATAEASIKQKATNVLNQYLANSQSNINAAANQSPYNLNILKNKARAELSLSAVDQKFNQDAEATLSKIVELSPTDPANLYNLGIFYQSTGQEEKATAVFQKTLELYPKHEAANAQLEAQKKTSP